MKLQAANLNFRFGNGHQASIGSTFITLPTNLGTSITVHTHVVDVSLPFLLGLDVCTQSKLVLDMDSDTLRSKLEGWTQNLIRRNGHLYWTWNLEALRTATSSVAYAYESALFTMPELRHLHYHFFHPTAKKLYNLIKRAHPEQLTPSTRKMLEDISRNCATCTTFSSKPLRFRVSMPADDLVFNQEISLDLFWLDGKAVLHIVDLGTGFSNAVFLNGHSVNDVWAAYTQCWSTVYVGHPNCFRTDSGSVFTSTRWNQLTSDNGIELKISGVESHNSLGLGERYHEPLRKIYRKLHHEAPDLEKAIVLRLALKAMNDTIGPEGLVPSYLVFGSLPKFPTVHASLPDQRRRMKALESARTEYATIVAKLRIDRALRAKVPPASKYIIVPGDTVYVYREGSKQFHGPLPVLRVEDKQIYVKHNNRLVQYNIAQVVPSSIFTDSHAVERLHDQVTPFRSPPAVPTSSTTPPTIPSHGIMITEVIPFGDKRNNDTRFLPAKRKELEGLLKRGTWKVVCSEDIPPDANVIGGRFVLCIKNAETKEPLYKARFIAQGHMDRDKRSIVHNSTTLQQTSIRVILAIAAIFGFRIWSTDITQAYIQSATELMRDIYIRPTKEFELAPNQLLKLLRPLYGLTESGEYWNYTFSEHMRKDLDMTQAVGDLSLFFKHVNGKLAGLAGTYVDDSMLSGNAKFMDSTAATAKRFESKEKTLDNFVFAGLEVSTTDKGFCLHQRKQVAKLAALPATPSFKDFKSKLMSLGWITHTRPDISCRVAQLAQVTEESFSATHVKDLNSTVLYVKQSAEQGIIQQPLDLDSLYIRVYTDASFANNADQSSQLGYIVALCDKFNRCNVLSFRSYKSRRVVRSVLGGEIYAFADGFDVAYMLRFDLESILNRTLRLCILTDSKSLFDTIVKNSFISEKRLMIDVQAAREAYQKLEISDIGHISGPDNPADGLTKPQPCPALTKLLTTGIADHPINQWVIRNNKSVFD